MLTPSLKLERGRNTKTDIMQQAGFFVKNLHTQKQVNLFHVRVSCGLGWVLQYFKIDCITRNTP